MSPRDICFSNQDVSVLFLKELQPANELLEQPWLIPLQLMNFVKTKQKYSEAFEVEKNKDAQNLHYWLLRDFGQINGFQFTFFSQLTVLDTVTYPQIKICSPFLRNF